MLLISRLSLILTLSVFAAVSLAATAHAGGTIQQKAGTDGCVTDAGTGGACQNGDALGTSASAAVSPDGRNLYGASAGADAVTVLQRDPVTGRVAQLSPTAGCVSETGSGGLCQDGIALDGALWVTVSPDGLNVYTASNSSDAIAIFDRNLITGELTQKAGTAGCISETGTAGACQDGVGLDSANTVIVSPDGRSVYATAGGSSAVSVFDRNPSTGALTQKAGTAGCISETGSSGACVDGTALSLAQGIVLSPDGTSVYASASGSDAVAAFRRDTATGALTQLSGTAGCISDTGSSGACQDGTFLDLARALTIAPDGRNLYVVSANSNALVTVNRDTATGAISQAVGPVGCVTETGSAGQCQDGVALTTPDSITSSPDGRSVYVGASSATDAITTFDRDSATGTLTQKAGKAGCVSETGTGGLCQDGVALDGVLGVTVSPDGRNLYSAAITSSGLVAFDRDQARVPVCASQVRSVAAGSAAAVALSCVDPDGFPLVFELVSQPTKGAVSGFDAQNGTLIYTPSAGAAGADTLTFRARNGDVTSVSATVTIDLLPVIAGPAGQNGAAGSAGATGARGPAGLAVAAFARTLRVRSGKRVALKYLSTSAGSATLEVRKSGKVVARIKRAMKRGTNTISWDNKVKKRAAKAGKYQLRLAVTADGQSAVLTVPLTVRR